MLIRAMIIINSHVLSSLVAKTIVNAAVAARTRMTLALHMVVAVTIAVLVMACSIHAKGHVEIGPEFGPKSKAIL